MKNLANYSLRGALCVAEFFRLPTNIKNGNLDKLNRWKVQDQKLFCHRRGLQITTWNPISKSQKQKDELAALAYAALIQNLQVIVNNE